MPYEIWSSLEQDRTAYQKSIGFIKNLLWPRSCLVCEKILYDSSLACLCRTCSTLVNPIDCTLHCPRCLIPIKEPNLYLNFKIDTCSNCEQLKPAFSKLICPYYYGPGLSTALHILKKGWHPEMAIPLGSLLTPLLENSKNEYDMIIPIPTTKSSLYQRGYNHVSLMLTIATEFLSYKPFIELFLLYRSEKSRSQKNLNRLERLSIPIHNFYIDKTKSSLLKNQRIMLIDDVITTGATLQACSSLLLEYGAKNVIGVSLFRTP